MPLTLGLPYPLLRAVTVSSHRRRPRRKALAQADPVEYFRRQYTTSASLQRRFMSGITFTGRRVLDVGGGLGGRVPHWLDEGASEVWCIDINREELALGQGILAREFPQYVDRVRFLHPDDFPADSPADLALLVDSFEHLEHPAAVLDQCAGALRPGGHLWIGSIGWYNYMASHCLGHIPVPWCQLLFSEKAIVRTIQTLLRDPAYQPNYWEATEGLARWDAVHALRERPGEPLNQLSLRSIRKELDHPAFRLASFRLHPIGGDRLLGRVVRPLLRVPGLDELLHGYYTAILERRE